MASSFLALAIAACAAVSVSGIDTLRGHRSRAGLDADVDAVARNVLPVCTDRTKKAECLAAVVASKFHGYEQKTGNMHLALDSYGLPANDPKNLMAAIADTKMKLFSWDKTEVEGTINFFVDPLPPKETGKKPLLTRVKAFAKGKACPLTDEEASKLLDLTLPPVRESLSGQGIGILSDAGAKGNAESFDAMWKDKFSSVKSLLAGYNILYTANGGMQLYHGGALPGTCKAIGAWWKDVMSSSSMKSILSSPCLDSTVVADVEEKAGSRDGSSLVLKSWDNLKSDDKTKCYGLNKKTKHVEPKYKATDKDIPKVCLEKADAPKAGNVGMPDWFTSFDTVKNAVKTSTNNCNMATACDALSDLVGAGYAEQGASFGAKKRYSMLDFWTTADTITFWLQYSSCVKASAGNTATLRDFVSQKKYLTFADDRTMPSSRGKGAIFGDANLAGVTALWQYAVNIVCNGPSGATCTYTAPNTACEFTSCHA